jgi:rare lipoprotein A (peptidoglycan hydrolase)
MEALLQDKNMKRICVLILVLLWAWSVVGNGTVPGDSLGLKVVEGKTFVVYKMSAGETAYAVSRKYGVSFKDLAAANAGTDMGALKVGQEILVPALTANNAANSVKSEPVVQKTDERVIEPEKEVIIEQEPERVVVKQEPVAAVSSNNEAVKEEEVLSKTDLSTTSPVAATDKTKSFAQLYAEYMSTEMIAASEKGVATWIENNGIQASGDRFYALHNSAPVGSIIKVRNLMNNRIIYAKVIGNLTESEVSEKVLIKLSAGAAERLNVLDNRFVVEMNYYINDAEAMK